MAVETTMTRVCETLFGLNGSGYMNVPQEYTDYLRMRFLWLNQEAKVDVCEDERKMFAQFLLRASLFHLISHAFIPKFLSH